MYLFLSVFQFQLKASSIQENEGKASACMWVC